MIKGSKLHTYKQTKSSIKTNCAIIAFLGLALLAASCGTPGSARSKARQSAKKSEQTQKNLASNDVISDFEAKVNNKKAKAKDAPAEEAEALSQQFDASRKRMPTLREQINELGARQEGLETKVNTIEKDVAEIKNSVDVIKEQMNGPRRSAPIAGIKNNASGATMQSDENSGDYSPSAIERDEAPAPAPKAKVATNSVAKKKNVTLKKPQKINKKAAKKKIAANKPAPAESKKVDAKKADKPKKEIAKPAEKKKEDNSAPTGNLTQAMRYFGAKNYNKAIAELNTAVQNTADPSMINSCNYWLGESYFGLGQFDKSVPYFKKVINSASQQKKAEAYAMLAEAYMRVGQVESAKREFSALIEKYPKSQYVPRAKKMLQQL